MKFTINKNVILEGLEKVAKAVPSTSTIPILNGMLLQVTQEEIVLTGSNSETSVRTVIPVDGEEAHIEKTGQTVLTKKALDIVKKLKNGSIVFETDEKDYTTIQTQDGKVEFTVAGFDAEEYPKLPNIDKDEEPVLSLEAKVFQDIIRKTAFNAADTEVRPILQAVLMDIQADCINFTATDSHRLGRYTLPHKSEKEAQYPVPASNLAMMLRVFDFSKDIEIYMLSDTQGVFRNGNTTYFTRLIDGNYPDTSKLLPKEFKTTIQLNRKELEQSLEQMAILGESKNHVVLLEVEGMMTSLKSKSTQSGKGKVEMAHIDLDGDDKFKISFSSRYALDAIKSISEEEVRLEFTGDMRPFLVRPAESKGDFLNLILPVRTTD